MGRPLFYFLFYFAASIFAYNIIFLLRHNIWFFFAYWISNCSPNKCFAYNEPLLIVLLTHYPPANGVTSHGTAQVPSNNRVIAKKQKVASNNQGNQRFAIDRLTPLCHWFLFHRELAIGLLMLSMIVQEVVVISQVTIIEAWSRRSLTRLA